MRAGVIITGEDPRAADVRRLLSRHRSFSSLHSPPEDAHVLDVEALTDPSVTFFAYRSDGELLGVAALRQLDETHAEVKSMHTAEQARGQGVGRRLLEHVLAVARTRGYERVSLETGSMDSFRPARRLYESAGFAMCEPFGSYRRSPYSVFMTLRLGKANGRHLGAA